MVTELKNVDNMQKEFIDNVSHEIKTPISSIKGFAKFLKNKNLSEEEREEYINIIIEESDRLTNLTGKMLNLSKLHNKNVIINIKEVQISEQIRRAICVLEPKWSSKNIKINVNLEEEKALGDEDLLFQVWMNLLENSIKFSNENGEIDINVYKENDKIITEISDHGIGIPQSDLEKIFERFYQTDKSHSGEGSGLGLAIVKRSVDLLGGNIKIESKQNKGTKTTVVLPIKI